MDQARPRDMGSDPPRRGSDALAALYPVCAAVMGAAVFREVARGYLAARGEGGRPAEQAAPDFPGFLVGTAVARRMPFLPDLARLECAVRRIGAGDDGGSAAPLAEAADGDIERAEVRLPERHALLMSPYPVSRIHAARREVGGGAERLLVLPGPRGAIVRRLAPGAFALVTAVAGGLPLGRAVIAAFEAEPGADPKATARALLRDGVFLRAA